MSIRSFPKLTAIAKIETEKEKEERQIERYNYSERKRPLQRGNNEIQFDLENGSKLQ